MNQVIFFTSYSSSPFRLQGLKNGISLSTFYNLVNTFLSKHNNSFDFQTEYSAYQFHRIYYSIQYLKCYSSFLNRSFNKKSIQKDYFPLLFYTRLFDTQYLSLIDYILDKYNEDLEQLYEDSHSSKHKLAFCDMQILNSFWFPIINKSIKELLFRVFEGDLQKIQEMCKVYLTKLILDPKTNYKYLALINNEIKTIEETTYPNPLDFKKRKEVINPQNAKTGSTNYIFNLVFSKCFFFHEWTSYFDFYMQSKSGYCSLDSCFQFTEEQFNRNEFYCSKKTITTCSEYTEYMDTTFLSFSE